MDDSDGHAVSSELFGGCQAKTAGTAKDQCPLGIVEGDTQRILTEVTLVAQGGKSLRKAHNEPV
jgi:hypothetical protein